MDEITAGAIVDSSATQFDLTTAVQFGYEQYARDTRCFPVNYTKASTAGTSTYAYSVFGTSSAGKRIFELRYVAYDETRLGRRTLDQLDREESNWRWNGNGTPRYWLPYGESTLMLYPTPSGTDNIYIEGWQAPDLTAFDAGTDEPLIHLSDRYLLALRGAIWVAERLVNVKNNLRYQMYETQYRQGIKEADMRINGQGHTTIFGRESESGGSRLNISSTILPPP